MARVASQDALTALALSFGAEFGFGENGHVHHLARAAVVRPRTGLVAAGLRQYPDMRRVGSSPSRTSVKTIRMPIS